MNIDVRPMREEDREQITTWHLQAFNLPEGDRERVEAIPVEDVRVVAEDDRPVASLRLLRGEHFFGGRHVSSADVTSVQVSPECRSKGYGGLLMREVLKELSAEGIALSTLYPSTQGVYRRVGFEVAGLYSRYRIGIGSLPRHRYNDVEAWGDDDLDEVIDCYHRVARSAEGLIHRPRSWWPQRILRLAPPARRPVYRYLTRREGRVTGYIVFTQEPDTSAPLPYYYDLSCRDLVWTDAESARSLLGLAASHRALASHFSWTGPVEDPLTFFFQEEEAQVQWSMLWMARLIDVAAALESRGYPPDLNLSLEFSLLDSVIDENQRAFRLEVSGGRGQVVPIEQAELQMDVRLLAALYTGWLPAREGARTGILTGANETDIRRLEALFAGPKPWLSDTF